MLLEFSCVKWLLAQRVIQCIRSDPRCGRKPMPNRLWSWEGEETRLMYIFMKAHSEGDRQIRVRYKLVTCWIQNLSTVRRSLLKEQWHFQMKMMHILPMYCMLKRITTSFGNFEQSHLSILINSTYINGYTMHYMNQSFWSPKFRKVIVDKYYQLHWQPQK